METGSSSVRTSSILICSGAMRRFCVLPLLCILAAPLGSVLQPQPLSTEPKVSGSSSGMRTISSASPEQNPAHGGPDPGARGPTGIAESDVVLDFARAIRVALEGQRLRVLLTRDGNQNPTFDNRSAMINGLSGTIFVSLHVSSTGPIGTARTYFYRRSSASLPATFSAPGGPRATPAQNLRASAPARSGLVEWDRAQEGWLDQSRQLAGLVQTEFAGKFKGSPNEPLSARIRQLRTIAAPAIAIEVSSIDVSDARRLEQMAEPLAEALARAVAEFRSSASAAAAGGREN
jgi:N-acetylmuramoyl-L-alanine amidase